MPRERDCVDIVSTSAEPTRNFYRVRFRNPKLFVGGKYTTPQWGQKAAMTIGTKYYGVSGCKITMAQPVGGRWMIQNVLIPKHGGVEMTEELALQIANHIQDRIEREGQWSAVLCRDNETKRYVSQINGQHIVRDSRGRFAPHAVEEFGADRGLGFTINPASIGKGLPTFWAFDVYNDQVNYQTCLTCTQPIDYEIDEDDDFSGVQCRSCESKYEYRDIDNGITDSEKVGYYLIKDAEEFEAELTYSGLVVNKEQIVKYLNYEIEYYRLKLRELQYENESENEPVVGMNNHEIISDRSIEPFDERRLNRMLEFYDKEYLMQHLIIQHIRDLRAYKNWVEEFYETKSAEEFEAESFRVGDEGMFEGGEVRITSIEDNSEDGRQNVYFFTYLDEEGNSDGFTHTSGERRFLNQFSMFPRDWNAEEFEAQRIQYDYMVHREPRGTEVNDEGKRIPNPRGGWFTSAPDRRDAEEFEATDKTRDFYNTCSTQSFNILGRKLYYRCSHIGTFTGAKSAFNKGGLNTYSGGKRGLRTAADYSDIPIMNTMAEISQEMQPNDISDWREVISATNQIMARNRPRR